MREKLKVILTYTALIVVGIGVMGASLWLWIAFIRFVNTCVCNCN